MPILAGGLIDAVDFTLPDPVDGYGNGNNTITSLTEAALPTTPLTIAITNPHPTANMLTLVGYSALMSATANDVRAMLDLSGATVIPPSRGAGSMRGWSDYLHTAGSALQQFSSTFTVELLPGTTTAKLFAYRQAATGTQQVNLPILRLVPLRFVS